MASCGLRAVEHRGNHATLDGIVLFLQFPVVLPAGGAFGRGGEIDQRRVVGKFDPEAAQDTGFRTLREEAEDMVARGVTTQEEVDRVLGTH